MTEQTRDLTTALNDLRETLISMGDEFTPNADEALIMYSGLATDVINAVNRFLQKIG